MSSSLLPTILVAISKLDLHSPLFGFLNNQEFEVTVAKDSAQVLTSLQASFFDLVLLDDNLHQLNELDILKTLRQNHPETVVNILTEEKDTLDNAILSLSYNIYDFIHKASDAATLHKTIHAALTERRFRILHRKTAPPHGNKFNMPHRTATLNNPAT